VQEIQSKIIDDLEDVAQVEQREIKTVLRLTDTMLDLHVNTKNEDGLDDQVDDDEPDDSREELALAHPG
jgi:hypothetical protein